MDSKFIEANIVWINEVWEKIEHKLGKVAVRSRNKLPYSSTKGVHTEKEPLGWWTNGFWGAMMWLMYSETQNEEYKKTAIRSEEMLDKALSTFDVLDHDVGFLWHILSGANYQLFTDEKSRTRNLFAAATLASRYNVDGGFIRAWNAKGKEGWSIIDCMMNLPLLYWASDVTGDDRFRRIAIHHADMAARDHIRADGSVNHIVEHDIDTGEVVKIHGGQGYDESSCWSRGLAWAIYGFTISYRHTKKKEYLDIAVRTANYFVANCRMYGYKTPVDFRQPLAPEYYDSTAGACAACGMLEISKYVSEAEGKMYTEEAINVLKATDKYFCDYNENTDSLVLCGTEMYPKADDTGLHIPIIYGDYFFVEGLLKLKGNEFFVW